MMGKKGYGAVGFVLLFLFLLIMWPFVIAPMLNEAGNQAIAGGATGLDAFLWANLNLWLFLLLVIIIIVYLRFGGQG